MLGTSIPALSFENSKSAGRVVPGWEALMKFFGGGRVGQAGQVAGAKDVLGAAITSLPPRYETVVVYDSTYYYANGAYYQAGSEGNYVVVPAPQGAIVQNAPTQVTNVYVNGEEYGYANGAYYDVKPPAEESGDPEFEVVAPPIGATVNSLPDDATTETVNDTAYFVYAGTYYKPFFSGNDIIYMVVKNPKA